MTDDEHAKECLVDSKVEGERLSQVYGLVSWENGLVEVQER